MGKHLILGSAPPMMSHGVDRQTLELLARLLPWGSGCCWRVRSGRAKFKPIEAETPASGATSDSAVSAGNYIAPGVSVGVQPGALAANQQSHGRDRGAAASDDRGRGRTIGQHRASASTTITIIDWS